MMLSNAEDIQADLVGKFDPLDKIKNTFRLADFIVRGFRGEAVNADLYGGALPSRLCFALLRDHLHRFVHARRLHGNVVAEKYHELWLTITLKHNCSGHAFLPDTIPNKANLTYKLISCTVQV
jgi:hypothetical protein